MYSVSALSFLSCSLFWSSLLFSLLSFFPLFPSLFFHLFFCRQLLICFFLLDPTKSSLSASTFLPFSTPSHLLLTPFSPPSGLLRDGKKGTVPDKARLLTLIAITEGSNGSATKATIEEYDQVSLNSTECFNVALSDCIVFLWLWMCSCSLHCFTCNLGIFVYPLKADCIFLTPSFLFRSSSFCLLFSFLFLLFSIQLLPYQVTVYLESWHIFYCPYRRSLQVAVWCPHRLLEKR